MKRVLFLMWGFCWVMFGLGFGFLLFEYIAAGAGATDFNPGLPFFGLWVTPLSVLMGLLLAIALVVAVGLCFAIGIGLWSRGMVGAPKKVRDEVVASLG